MYEWILRRVTELDLRFGWESSAGYGQALGSAPTEGTRVRDCPRRFFRLAWLFAVGSILRTARQAEREVRGGGHRPLAWGQRGGAGADAHRCIFCHPLLFVCLLFIPLYAAVADFLLALLPLHLPPAAATIPRQPLRGTFGMLQPLVLYLKCINWRMQNNNTHKSLPCC